MRDSIRRQNAAWLPYSQGTYEGRYPKNTRERWRHSVAPPNRSHLFTTPTRFSGPMQPFDNHGATLLTQQWRQPYSAGSGEKESVQKALEAAAEYPDVVELD